MSSDRPPQLDELLQHREFLERFARGLARDASVADDVVQETWLAALERPPRHHGDLRAWLLRVARNVFLRRQRARTTEPIEALSIAEPESSDDPVERESVSRSLASELLSLPEPYCRVLILRYYEDKTPTEIARELGRPVNTVTSQIGRGLKLMQERLDRSHPDGRSRWLRVLVPLARVGPPDTSRSDRRGVPVARAIGSARAMALLGAALAAVASVVLVLMLRAPARGPGGVTEGPRVAERDATLVSPAVPEARTPAARDAVDPGVPDPEPEPAGAPPLASLVVEVVTAEGTPVEGAGVRTTRDRAPPGSSQPMITLDGQDRTDASGRVEIRLTDEHRVRFGMSEVDQVGVAVEASGFVASDLQGMLFPDGAAAFVTVRLEPATIVVHGRVTDEVGAPLEGALVRIGRTQDQMIELGDGRFLYKTAQSRRTGADGRFEHVGLSAGTLGVWVECPGFVAHTGSLTVSDPSVTLHDVVLQRGCTVAGRVTTADGAPAAGSPIRAESVPSGPDIVVQEAVADADGRFELRGLAPGRAWLIARHATSPDLAALTHVQLQQGVLQWSPVLEVMPPLGLRVQREDGSPLGGAIVGVHTTNESEAWQRFLRTDANGVVRFEPVPATDLTAAVFLTPKDRQYGVPPCHAQDGLRGGLEESVLTVPRASLERGGIRGIVLARDGEPFAHAVLQIRSRPGPFFFPIPVAPETGGFEGQGLPEQTYDVVVWCAGLGTVPLGPIEVLAHDTFDFGEIPLPPPISWSPVPPDSAAAAGDEYKLVKIDSLEGLEEKHWLVASGALTSQPSFLLFPGRYGWLVYRDGELVRRENVEVR